MDSTIVTRPRHGFDSYFTEVSFRKRVFYVVLVVYVAAVVLISLVEPFLTPESCRGDTHSGLAFGNSLFKYNPCRYTRKYYLLFLSPDECSFSRRLVIAVILGGFIGWERVCLQTTVNLLSYHCHTNNRTLFLTEASGSSRYV